jgi:hypothetical protein
MSINNLDTWQQIGFADRLRVAVSKLLDLHIAQVPYFPDGASMDILTDLTAYLRTLGLYPLAMIVDETNLEWFDAMRGKYILVGLDQEEYLHCVVATGRAITVLDPLDERNEKLSPYLDTSCKVNVYTAIAFVKLYE